MRSWLGPAIVEAGGYTRNDFLDKVVGVTPWIWPLSLNCTELKTRYRRKRAYLQGSQYTEDSELKTTTRMCCCSTKVKGQMRWIKCMIFQFIVIKISTISMIAWKVLNPQTFCETQLGYTGSTLVS